MYLELPPGPLDRVSLSRVFGFTVPEPFVALIQALYEESGGDTRRCGDLFTTISGLYFAGEDARYPQTPPELFPFASLGVDGVHYGYVIHAPELAADDYPIGEFCPMDFDGGVFFVGSDTREAFENLMSFQLDFHNEMFEGSDQASVEKARAIERISELLGVHPAAEKADRRYDSEGNGLPIEPVIPQGWRYVPSSDGIGVLAPADAFRPGGLTVLDPFGPAEPYLQLAYQAIEGGFPATALYYLREGYWHSWTEDRAAASFSAQLVEAYNILGRTSLAQVVDRRELQKLRFSRRM